MARNRHAALRPLVVAADDAAGEVSETATSSAAAPPARKSLREAMRQRGQTLKQTLNYAVRRGLAGIAGDPERPPFVQRTFPMGVRAGYDLGKLSALEAEMDTEAFLDVTRRLIDDGAGSGPG